MADRRICFDLKAAGESGVHTSLVVVEPLPITSAHRTLHIAPLTKNKVTSWGWEQVDCCALAENCTAMACSIRCAKDLVADEASAVGKESQAPTRHKERTAKAVACSRTPCRTTIKVTAVDRSIPVHTHCTTGGKSTRLRVGHMARSEFDLIEMCTAPEANKDSAAASIAV